MRRTAREGERSRGEVEGSGISVFNENAAREVGGTVLSGAPDRMCATSREAVQFINVIYGEANAFPEPSGPSFPRSFGSANLPALSATAYPSCIESIEFCFTWPSGEKKESARPPCLHAYTRAQMRRKAT